jgi:hypothetical protein
MPEGTETDVEKDQRPVRDKSMSKKPKPIQKLTQQKKGVLQNNRQKDTTPTPKEPEKWVVKEQGTSSTTTPQNKARPRDPSSTLGLHAKIPRHTSILHNIQSPRMMLTSWPKESRTVQLRSLKMPNTKEVTFWTS